MKIVNVDDFMSENQTDEPNIEAADYGRRIEQEREARESCQLLGLNEDTEWRKEADRLRELRIRLKVLGR